jgi:hypothetical protein
MHRCHRSAVSLQLHIHARARRSPRALVLPLFFESPTSSTPLMDSSLRADVAAVRETMQSCGFEVVEDGSSSVEDVNGALTTCIGDLDRDDVLVVYARGFGCIEGGDVLLVTEDGMLQAILL